MRIWPSSTLVGYRSRGRGGGPDDDTPLLVKHAVVTWAEELLAIFDPAHAASQMGADVRHRGVLAPVFRQNVDRQLLGGSNPAGLAFDGSPKQGRGPGLDLVGRPKWNPGLGLLASQGRPDQVGQGRQGKARRHQAADRCGGGLEELASRVDRILRATHAAASTERESDPSLDWDLARIRAMRPSGKRGDARRP